MGVKRGFILWGYNINYMVSKTKCSGEALDQRVTKQNVNLGYYMTENLLIYTGNPVLLVQ
jgi:hypothetical protein